MRLFAIVSATVVSFLSAGAARAAVFSFTASMNGASERPTPVATAGTGSCTITLDTGPLGDQGSTVINCTFANLTSNANNAHIHGPADVNTASGVILPMTFTPAPSGTAQGSGTLARAGFTTQQLTDAMRAGQSYVNIHSVNFPGGEIRGQVLPVAASVPASSALTRVLLGLLLLGGSAIFLVARRRRLLAC
jgi:CHRD domain